MSNMFVLSESDRKSLKEISNVLPSAYDFELEKTIVRIRKDKCKRVALQLPEGLMRYATTLSLLIESFTKAIVIILADVTYGACCINDCVARLMDIDLLIHYGHSCLIPIKQMEHNGSVLYIFVRIHIDCERVSECLMYNFCANSRLALVSTIQFTSCLRIIKKRCEEKLSIMLPQTRPLSSGEILGCTAPTLNEPVDAMVYIGDGRFHLEAIMMANAGIPAYKFDPYSQTLTKEFYDNARLLKTRLSHIEIAKKQPNLILVVSTLGRQGSPSLVARLYDMVRNRRGNCIKVAMHELNPVLLTETFSTFFGNEIPVFLHVSCPRLSTDWCSDNDRSPSAIFLNSYETTIFMGENQQYGPNYPMQYYAHSSPQTYNVRYDHSDRQTK